MRFRTEQHVRRQRDFRELREKGRRFDCGGFAFWHFKRAADESVERAAKGRAADVSVAPLAPETVRVAVVASYAAVGNAVQRARAKRRLREVFRRNQQLVPAGHDVMLVAKRSLNATEFPVIEQKFTDACRRVFQGQGQRQKQGQGQIIS